MNGKRILVVCVLTAFVATASVTAWGLHSGIPGIVAKSGCLFNSPVKRLVAGHVGRLLVLRSDLDITDEQKEKVSALVKSRLDEIVPIAKTVIDKRRALREAVLKEPVDEKAIRSAALDLTKSIGDASVLASRVIAEARPVLTAKQVKLIRDFKTEVDKATLDWLNQLGR